MSYAIEQLRGLVHDLHQRVAALEARPELPDIERLQAAGVRPGDTIIATVPGEILYEHLLQLQETLQAKFPGREIIVLAGGIELTTAQQHRPVSLPFPLSRAMSERLWQRIAQEDT